MHLPADITPDTSPEAAALEIMKIDVSGFDSERHELRRKMVSQRFVLGLVEMFEKFPDLPYVFFVHGETALASIQLPSATDLGLDLPAHAKLKKQVVKSLQSARAAITPQARDTLEALSFYFARLPSCEISRGSHRASGRAVMLHRQVFDRECLPLLTNTAMTGLDGELCAQLIRQRLNDLAAPAIAARDASTAAKIKM